MIKPFWAEPRMPNACGFFICSRWAERRWNRNENWFCLWNTETPIRSGSGRWLQDEDDDATFIYLSPPNTPKRCAESCLRRIAASYQITRNEDIQLYLLISIVW